MIVPARLAISPFEERAAISSFRHLMPWPLRRTRFAAVIVSVAWATILTGAAGQVAASAKPADEVMTPPAISPDPALIVNPVFLYRPTYREMLKYYPVHAYTAGVAGTAQMHCDVLTDGKAANCKILHEEPRGESFGQATLALAKLLKFKPRTRDGLPEEGGIFETTVHWTPPIEK